MLLVDNHHSHISIAAIDYCIDRGIIILSFPPSYSHKLQPICHSVYGPLKKICEYSVKSHPGKTMTIDDPPRVLKEILPHAVTPRYIQKGFEVNGIYPFNRNIFGDEEFLPGYVTNGSMDSTVSDTNQEETRRYILD